MTRTFVTLLTIVSLAACSSAARQSILLPSVPSAIARHDGGVLVLRVIVPRSDVTPHYASPSTKGMTVNITGPTNVKKTVGLKVTSNGCKSSLMTLQCTLEVPGLHPCPSSSKCYTGSVTTYDAYAHGKIPNKAHALSEDLKFGFSIGSTPTVIPMILYGIPKSVKLFPDASSNLTGSQQAGFVEPKCTASKQTVNAVAEDADGNMIVGVGAPKITLKSDDTSQLRVSGGKGGSFNLTPPALPSYPYGGHTIHLAAKATAPKGAGGASVTTPIAVSYSGDICGVFTEFAIPAGSTSEPFGITVGPDGALWFTEDGAAKIGKVTTTGTFTIVRAITAGAQPLGIVTGPDHNLWFVEQHASKIGRITTGGTLVEFPTLTASSAPTVITTGPDGRLWFTERDGNNIGAITVAGSMHEYPVPTSTATTQAIVTGPGGTLFFAELTGNKIGQITTAGTITETTVPTASVSPVGIVTGSDGQIWFTEGDGNAIGRLTPSLTGNVISSQVPLPEASSEPLIDTLGPDGNVWFTENTGNRIGRIDYDGRITEFAVPTGGSVPGFVVTGPDGALWFTEVAGGKIGRLR